MASLAHYNPHPLDCTGCTTCSCLIRKSIPETHASTSRRTTVISPESNSRPTSASAKNRFSFTSYRGHSSRWWVWMLLFALVIVSCMEKNQVEANSVHRRFYRRAVRLCSRSLSDALYLLCKDRGFVGPFDNSGENDGGAKHNTGPGLVEECCYNACTIEQMEQYCNPIKPTTAKSS